MKEVEETLTGMKKRHTSFVNTFDGMKVRISRRELILLCSFLLLSTSFSLPLPLSLPDVSLQRPSEGLKDVRDDTDAQHSRGRCVHSKTETDFTHLLFAY